MGTYNTHKKEDTQYSQETVQKIFARKRTLNIRKKHKKNNLKKQNTQYPKETHQTII